MRSLTPSNPCTSTVYCGEHHLHSYFVFAAALPSLLNDCDALTHHQLGLVIIAVSKQSRVEKSRVLPLGDNVIAIATCSTFWSAVATCLDSFDLDEKTAQRELKRLLKLYTVRTSLQVQVQAK
jgi:hypothetical protein